MSESGIRRSMRPRPGPMENRTVNDAQRIIVKLKDGVDIPYEDGAERYLGLPGTAMASAGDLGFRVNRLFTVLEPGELKDLVNRARERDPALPDFLKFFVIEVPSGLSPDIALERCRALSAVETAYVDAPGMESDVNPDDDDPAAGWVQNQGYLDPAPDGIDAEFAWPRADGTGFTGGDGAGVRLIDLERGWNFSHPDLKDHNIQLLHGQIRPQSIGHGNATLGVLCARDNVVGCVGIAPWVDEVGVVSYWQSTRAAALLAAVVNLSAGDVLVVESQLDVQIGPASWFAMPIEVLDAEFWLIRLATALGITVIEAAGNSYERLDDFVNAAGKKTLNRGDPSLGFRDSGAIMVSAASSAHPHEPMIFEPLGDRMHHYGTRIDCYAWGDNVTTLTATDYVLGGYASTSAATAIIGGAAVVLQGVARANGRMLSPGQVRLILADKDNGTESKNGAAVDGLGVMPDLRKILLTNNALGILPDVYLRDFIGDDGDPHLGAISASPDVLVVPQQSGDPQTDFGDPSTLFGSEAEAGQSNFLYVRAWNRGLSDALDVVATVYWSEVATLVSPDQWTLVGSVVIPVVQAGNVLTVSPAIEWTAAQIPGTGHYCFVAILDHPKDPGTNPTDLASLVIDWKLDWINFQRLIRENNNITWRNFNVVSNIPDASIPGYAEYVVLPFVAVGAPDRARPMRLRFGDRLPEGSRLLLEVPISIHEWAATGSGQGQCHAVGENRVRVPLRAGGCLLDEFAMPARARFPMKLMVQIPSYFRENPYEVRVSQLLAGEEVGRVTWRLVPTVERQSAPAGVRLQP